MSHEEQNSGAQSPSMRLPKPTAWPFVMAFGVTFIFLGLVTYPTVSILGIVLFLLSIVGWFRQVLPHEVHESIPIVKQELVFPTDRKEVEKAKAAGPQPEYFPVEAHPLLSGIKGGITGGIAMSIVALIYGGIAHNSIWWAVNLLGGAGVAVWRNPTPAQIAAFHWQWLLIACVIQGACSLLAGLVYGGLLPMLPRYPIIIGGIVVPIVWTGFVFTILHTINPVLDFYISWPWFTVSEIAFGLMASWMVSRDMRRPKGTRAMPLAMRMGIEATGLMHEREGDEQE